jgi:catechol 2,3-dioxygenase-like lactoylglutathione lyase family enzyme
MITHFDHVTVAVRDLQAAIDFFSLLGFEEDKRVVIKDEPFSGYMGVSDIEADHVTLAIPEASPRFEVQVLHYRTPEAAAMAKNNPRLDKLGFNHICFAVKDAETMIKHLKSNDVYVRSELKNFHSRQLFFVTGPEGITVELAEWRD